jgi:hypothetical protein
MVESGQGPFDEASAKGVTFADSFRELPRVFANYPVKAAAGLALWIAVSTVARIVFFAALVQHANAGE